VGVAVGKFWRYDVDFEVDRRLSTGKQVPSIIHEGFTVAINGSKDVLVPVKVVVRLLPSVGSTSIMVVEHHVSTDPES
jgi:hypothetical protein